MKAKGGGGGEPGEPIRASDAPSSQAEAFCADEASLQAGLGDSFAAARPGVVTCDCLSRRAVLKGMMACGIQMPWQLPTIVSNTFVEPW